MLEVPRRPFVKKKNTCLDCSCRIRDDHVCSSERFIGEFAVSSTSTLAIDVRLSDTAVSPLLHRCCCIVSLCLQQATVFRAVRLLLAAHKFL